MLTKRQTIQLPGDADKGKFIELRSRKGCANVIFLSKPVESSEVAADAPISINGNCKYQLLYTTADTLCGVLISSPRHATRVTPWSLAIGTHASHRFEHRSVLSPQGLQVFEAPDDGLVVVSSIDTPLLVKSSEQ